MEQIKILCPVDFTESSLNSLNYAFELAREFKGELVLLHSVHLSGFENEGDRMPAGDLYEIEEKAKEKLDAICERLEQFNTEEAVRYYYIVKFGFAEDTILSFIQNENVDLVVLSTKGAKGIEKLLSTLSADIAVKAPCPVLVIPSNYSYKHLKEIVYATDLSGHEEAQIKYISDFARTFDAHLAFLNIQKENYEDIEAAANNGQEILKQSGYKNMSFHVIGKETVLEGINSFAHNKNADLLVMSAKDKNLLQHLFTFNHTRQEIYQAKIPLLVMHKERFYQPLS